MPKQLQIFLKKSQFEFKPHVLWTSHYVTFQYFMKSQKINNNKTLVICRSLSKLYTRLKTENVFDKVEKI